MNAQTHHAEEINFLALAEFFRKMINEDYGDAAVMMEADPKKVLTYYLTPWAKGFVTETFLKSKIFGEVICSKLDKYRLESIGGYKPNDQHQESIQLYHKFVEFNPDVVYVKFDGTKENDNLVVLKRQSLSEENKKELVSRAEEWLPVLYEVEKDVKDFFWFRLSNSLESLLAKVDPIIDRPFVYYGKAIGFVTEDSSPNNFPTVGNCGMVVDCFENHPCSNGALIPLVNVCPERFSHLVGRTVKYHFLDINRNYYGAPYGELITIIPHSE